MKTKCPFYVKRAAGALALGASTALATIQLDHDAGRISLKGDGFLLKNIQPRVEVLVGADKTAVNYVPTSTPVVSTAQEQTPLGVAENTIFEWKSNNGFALLWTVSMQPGSKVATLQCALRNDSDKNMLIQQFYILEAPTGQLTVEGDASDWMTSSRYLKYARYFDSLDKLQKRGQLSHDNPGKAEVIRHIPYEEDFCLYTDNGQRGLSISPVTDISYCWGNLTTPEDGKLGLDFTSEMSCILVEPGETRSSERVLVQLLPWKAASENVVCWMKSSFKPRNTPPIFGWCSWYCAGSSVTEEHCYDVTKLIKENWDRYPVETIQIDDGWQIQGSYKFWLPNKKFYKGMTALADTIAETSSMPGIWMTPTSLRGDGTFDDSWYIGYRTGEVDEERIDPSSPGGREYILSSLRNLNAQGYTYFKTDFSQVIRKDEAYADPKLTSYQAQRLLYSVIREAIGEESYLLACNGGPMRAILGLADATRIGTDTGTRRGFCHGINDFGKPTNVHGAWFPMLQIGNASFYTHLLACDPDVTRLDNDGYERYDPRKDPERDCPKYISFAEVQTFHSMQGLYGGLMMVSDLIDKPGYHIDNRMRMFEIMHPCTNEKGYNFAGGSDILSKQFGFAAERPWGNFVSMLTWNPEHKEKKDLKIDLAPIENVGDTFHIWSFWDEAYLGIQDASYVFKDVPKYNCKLLRLTAVDPKERPTLIGSNFHMSVGESEIKKVKASAKKITVELVPSAAAIEGQLAFYSKQPLALKKAVGCEAFVMKTADNAYTAVITARDRQAGKHAITLVVADEEPVTLNAVKKDAELNKKYLAGSMLNLK